MGRITIDDVVDLIKEEAEKDCQLAAGISDVEANDGVAELTKPVCPGFSWTLGWFGQCVRPQDFEQAWNCPNYGLFTPPLIAAMAGNVGVQSSAIIVQGLANNVVKGSLIHLLFKEIGLSLINGLALSVILILLVWSSNKTSHQSHNCRIYDGRDHHCCIDRYFVPSF